MGRRKKTKMHLQPCRKQAYQDVIWMKIDGIFWPVQVVTQAEETLNIYIDSDNAQFEVKKQDKNIMPFYENFERLKAVGNDFLKKKRRLETLKAFLQDVAWAKSLYDRVASDNVQDEAMTDREVHDEVTTEGVVHDEVTTEGVVQDESIADGTTLIESMTDRAVHDEVTTEGVVHDEVTTEGVVQDESIADGTTLIESMTDRVVHDEAMTDREVHDEVTTEGVVHDEVTTEGVVQDESIADGTTLIESMTDRVVHDEAMTDREVHDEVTTEGVVQDEVTTEGVVQDESIADGTTLIESMTDRVVHDEAMTDREVHDEVTTEGVVHDEVTTEGVVQDESIADGTTLIESMTDRAVHDEFITDGAVKYDANTEGAVQDEVMTNRAVQDESITQGGRAVQVESMTDGAVQDKFITDGEVQDGSGPEWVVQVVSFTDRAVQVESTDDRTAQNDPITDRTAPDESITEEAVQDESMTEMVVQIDYMTDGEAVLSQNKDPESTTDTMYISDSEYESDTIPVCFPQLSFDKLKGARSSGEKRPHSQVDYDVESDSDCDLSELKGGRSSGEKRPNSQVDYDDVENDSDCDLSEDEILRDKNNKKLYIRKVLTSTTTKLGKKKKTDRVYNSYHNCTYCDKLCSNFAQHMKRRHLKEADVEKIYAIGDEKKRRRQIALLSAEMDHVHNMKVKKNEGGEILLYRRPSSEFQFDSFGPCPSCFLWISKKMLRRHQKVCIGNNEKELNYSELITRSDTLADRISDVASSVLVEEVFRTMNNDDIGIIAREDNLIVRLGNMWMDKNHGNKLKRGKYTSQIMRMVARLLINIQKETNTDLSLSEYLKPCYFDDIARSTLITAGQDVTDNEYLENPSNAIKLGHDIKRIVNIKIGVAIMVKDREAEEDAERFLKLMSVFWGTRVTKLARNTLVERQFNKRQVLPDPGDIQKLNEYLNTQLSKIDVGEVSMDNYTKIARLVATKLLQYNRRRPGEIEAVTLVDYGARMSGASESRSAVFGDLTKFERKLMEKQDVLTTRGKGHRGVPILIPEGAKPGIAYIASSQVRETVGINSRYLFASAGSEFRLYGCLVEHCEKADLSYPQRITATALRKYMATVTQALDLKPHQIDWVMRHMGHSLDVHKIYYRSTSDIIERTQIAKILLLQDTGRLDEFANQSLEDIQLSELAEEAGGNPDDVPMEELFAASEDMNEDEDTEEDDTNLAESSETRPGQRAKKNSAVTRQKWSSDEEKDIGQIFEKYINEKRRPTPKQCLKAMRISKKNGGVIHLRKKDVLKKKVYRMIDNLDK